MSGVCTLQLRPLVLKLKLDRQPVSVRDPRPFPPPPQRCVAEAEAAKTAAPRLPSCAHPAPPSAPLWLPGLPRCSSEKSGSNRHSHARAPSRERRPRPAARWGAQAWAFSYRLMAFADDAGGAPSWAHSRDVERERARREGRCAALRRRSRATLEPPTRDGVDGLRLDRADRRKLTADAQNEGDRPRLGWRRGLWSVGSGAAGAARARRGSGLVCRWGDWLRQQGDALQVRSSTMESVKEKEKQESRRGSKREETVVAGPLARTPFARPDCGRPPSCTTRAL